MGNFFQGFISTNRLKTSYYLLTTICFTLLSFASSSAHATSWQSNDYILESFNKIAMNGSKVKKWQAPIYYQIAHHVDDIELHEKLVAMHFKQLQQITGLKIQPADLSHKANLTVVLTTEKQFSSDAKHYFNLIDPKKIDAITRYKIGATSLFTNTNGYIEQSVVIIPTDRARAYARLLTSFSEMLTKALGLQYRSESVAPSIFNQRSTNVSLSGLDYVMLKLLYDNRIRPSMNGVDVQQLVKSILSEKKYQNHIFKANVAVMQNGFNLLFN